MLRNLFLAPMVWIDGSPGRYWLVGALLLGLVLTTSQLGRDATKKDWWRHPVCFLVALSLALLFFRLPTITNRSPFNEDESYFLAGALTLRHDPLFWRSVQSTSSGPLNYYVLLLAAVVGMPLDFLAARVIACGLFVLLLGLHYALVKRLTNDDLARQCTLPIWAVTAFACDPGLVNYHSELVSMALLQSATYFLVRYWLDPGKTGWLIAAGLLLGCLPWAKLQAAPAGVGLAVLGMAAILCKKGTWRQGLFFTAAGLLPTLTVCAFLAMTGVWESMWLSYLRWNLHLAERRTDHFSFSERCWDLIVILLSIPAVREFFAAWMIGVLGGALLWRRVSWRTTLFPLLLGTVPLVLLGFGILVSGNILQDNFRHYLLFLLFPAALVQACLLGLGRGVLLRGLALASTLCIALSGGGGIENYLERAAYFETEQPDEVTTAILAYSRDDDALFVWGWAPRYFPLTQRRQATPYPATEHEFDNYHTDYFRQHHLQQLRRSNPPVIVDEVGEKSVLYRDRATFGHEIFPDLHEFIAANYVQVGDWPAGRVYVRRDVLK